MPNRLMRVSHNKFNVRTDAQGKRERTVDGILFASKKEARRYGELKLLERAGDISDLTTQVRYDLWENGIKICTYVADFTYRALDGVYIAEDCKGFKTDVYKIKKKLMKAILGIDVKEV